MPSFGFISAILTRPSGPCRPQLCADAGNVPPPPPPVCEDGTSSNKQATNRTTFILYPNGIIVKSTSIFVFQE